MVTFRDLLEQKRKFIGTYIMYFLAVPLQRFMYVHLTSLLDKKKEVYPEHD